MNAEQVAVVTECARLSAEGRIPFGEVVARMIAVGVERYHADYCRMENTYYAGDGSSCVVGMGQEGGEIAEVFSAADVEAAVRGSQRGEVKYPVFVTRTRAAGCVGYFVQLEGKCVQYFGRRGEVHMEWFPGAR